MSKPSKDEKPKEHFELHMTRKKWAVTLISILVLLIAVGIVKMVISINRFNANSPYCDSIDITGCSVLAEIYNDTNAVYIVKQCSSNDLMPCAKVAITTTLEPGGSYSANGSSDDTPQPWLVLDGHGKVFGCLNLAFTKYQKPPVLVPLSRALLCNDVNKVIKKFNKDNVVF